MSKGSLSVNTSDLDEDILRLTSLSADLVGAVNSLLSVITIDLDEDNLAVLVESEMTVPDVVIFPPLWLDCTRVSSALKNELNLPDL